MEKLLFKVEQTSDGVAQKTFEGPLDLLLTLIAKHKLNIFDIQISELLSQYMAAIEQMQSVDLEIASEFLEMASRLVYIKTAMLLPRHEEDGKRLHQELVGQLLEYRVCRMVAQTLGERARLLTRFVRPAADIEIDETYQLQHEAAELLAAYRDAVGRGKRRLPPPAQAFTALVSRRVVSVASRIVFVLKKLYASDRYDYELLFMESEDRSELVATFMAVLELMKARRVVLDEQGQIILRHYEGMPERPDIDDALASEFDTQSSPDVTESTGGADDVAQGGD